MRAQVVTPSAESTHITCTRRRAPHPGRAGSYIPEIARKPHVGEPAAMPTLQPRTQCPGTMPIRDPGPWCWRWIGCSGSSVFTSPHPSLQCRLSLRCGSSARARRSEAPDRRKMRLQRQATSPNAMGRFVWRVPSRRAPHVRKRQLPARMHSSARDVPRSGQLLPSGPVYRPSSFWALP